MEVITMRGHERKVTETILIGKEWDRIEAECLADNKSPYKPIKLKSEL